MYDQRLIRKINQGRCFAFVGSGPSTEVGYASWGTLAENVVAELKRIGIPIENAAYEKYLAAKQYPELFSQVERDLGSRRELLELLSKLFMPDAARQAYTYDLLTHWPFACYLTTNWDDRLLVDSRSTLDEVLVGWVASGP